MNATAPPGSSAPRRGEAVAVTSHAAVEGTARRLTAAFVTAFFFAVVFGCAAMDFFWPEAPPTLVGFEKAQQDEKRNKARFADGTLAKLVEDDLESTSRVRRTANAIYAPLLLRVFREGGPSHVVGPNHYLFRRDRIRVATPRDTVIGLAAGRFRAIDRVLGHLGTRFVAVPLPRKELVMAAELPPGLEVHPEYDEQLAASLRAAGVDFVDLIPAFRAAGSDPIYPAADSHWSAPGALVAARAIASALLQPGEQLQEPKLIQATEDSGRMFAYALGVTPTAAALMPHAPMAQIYFADRKVVQTTSQPPAGELPLLLTGTSFSKGAGDDSTFFAEALSALLGKPVWNGARSGVTGHQSLDSALRAIAGRPLPRLVVMEQPNHYSLSFEYPMHEIGDLLARLPIPPGLQPLQHGRTEQFGIQPFEPDATLRPGALRVVNTPPLLARLPWDAFVYPRDGTVGVLVHAKVGAGGGDLMAAVDIDRSKLFVHWPEGRDAVLFPVAGDRLGQRFDVFAWTTRGEVDLDLTSVEVVCDLDLAHGRRGEAQAPVATAPDEWTVTIAFAGEPLADACVGIEIDGIPGPTRQRQVDAWFTNGETMRLYGPELLRPGARLLLPLGPAARALQRLEIRGSGFQPTAPIRAFWLPRNTP